MIVIQFKEKGDVIMRLLPSMNNLFDDFFDDKFFAPSTGMRTDIKETDDSYVLNMELPGYKKEDIQLSIKNGYLNILAKADTSKEEKDKKGNLIRSERYHGQCSRSFYIGDQVSEEDIKASFDNGELIISFPKETKTPEIENHYITIE